MARSARSKGLKDKKYLQWISRLPCIICWNGVQPGVFHNSKRPSGHQVHPMPFNPPSGRLQQSRTEVAHVGDRGLSQKCSDRETIPLCAEHHRLGASAHHVLGRKFWDIHGLDRDVIIAELNARYEAERTA